MTAGERFKSWIDGLAESWKDRLRGWMASWVDKGFTTLFVGAEPITQDMMRDAITRIANIPGIPPDYKKGLLDSLTHADWQRTQSGWFWYLFGILPSILSSGQPFANLVNYDVELLQRTSRLDPISVITAWRRDPAKYERYFLDLKEQGWSDDRIEALKFFTLFYPSPRDLIGFLAHEVYEDDMAARYGLDMDFAEVAKHIDKFEKAGMAEPQVKEFWRDHWEHTSYMQMVELLHRGLLTETGQPPPTTIEGWEARDAEGTEILRDWYKLVEIADFWRDKLTAMSWNVPTRVDVRRWWDMRTISEDELRNIYHRQGYHGDDLENYVRWTKVYTDFPMMMTRWKNTWITEQDVRDWLADLKIPADRIEQFIQEKTKPEAPARVEKERDLTATDIIMGVKKGVISRAEGIELLGDLGYDEDEAAFKIDVRITTEGGSPETFGEFKDLTQKWRKAVGKEAKPVTEELKQAAVEVVKLTKDVDNLRKQLEQFNLETLEVEWIPKEIILRRTELEAMVANAERKLALVKSRYDNLLTQWRHHW